ncbi:hypothetical protein F4826_004928 [Rahnella inusitata]|nr:hypothetical protein [Rahnella inusitata]
MKLQPDLWAEYASREVTRWEHLAELYRYLELSPFNRALQKICIRHLYPHAMRTDKGFLLAEGMLSWLRNNNVIFPSADVIERTLAEAATLADRQFFLRLPRSLNQGTKRHWTVCWYLRVSNPHGWPGCSSLRGKLMVKMSSNISIG